MKQTAKKAVSLFLSLLFLLALVPTASAVICNHNYGYTKVPVTEVTSSNNNTCTADVYYYKQCNGCGRNYERLEKIDFLYGPHPYQTYSVTCNGLVQTLNQGCTRCGHRNQATQVCPASPHTGLCPALPLSVGPEVSIM